MKTIMGVVSFLFISSACIANGSQCVDLLTSEIPSRFSEEITVTNSTVKDGTLSFIDFFDALLQQRRVGIKELINVIDGLNEDEIRNPIFIKDKVTNSDSLVAYNIFQEYLDKAELNREQIRDWAEKRLKMIEKVIGERNLVSEDTRSGLVNMMFFPVTSNIRKIDYLYLKIKNKFNRKNNEKQLPINHQYELMSTKVTQNHWLDHMKETPEDSRHYSYSNPIALGPDRAVNRVSWWSSLEFANRKSLKEGLKPVYDFSGIDFEGSAEDGTLSRKSGELKINAPNGDILRSEGYRLPTVSEFNNILGKIKNKLQYAKQIDELFVSATGKSGGFHQHSPWDVTESAPITVDGYRFYDLLDISGEWLYSSLNKNPISQKNSIYYPKLADNEYRDLIITNFRSVNWSNVGFRLVRTITEDKK